MGKRANGEGNFTTLPNGKIKYRVTAPKGYDKNEISVTANSKTECKELMKKKLEEIEKLGFNKDYQKASLLELVQAHFEYDLRHLKPKGADRREVTINNQIKGYRIANYQVVGIKDKDILKHIDELKSKGYSISTIEKAYDVINSAFNWGINNDYLTFNPCKKVHSDIKKDFQKSKRNENATTEIKVLSEDDEKTLFKELDIQFGNGVYKYQHIRDYVRILIETGMRCGELCALKWENYNPQTKTLMIKYTRGVSKNRDNSDKTYSAKDNIVKTDVPRTITVNDTVADILDKIKSSTRYNKDTDYILLTRNGTPSNSNQFSARIDKVFKNCGLFSQGISGAHIFRRTFATNMHHSGVSVSEIADYMGDLEETVRKCYINPSRQIKQGNTVINAIPLPKKKIV